MPDFVSIVVLGAMNPKIHHPHWYFAQKLLTAAERDAALAADVVCTPPIAQFRAPEFAVVCQQESWEIQTTLSEAVGRIEDIAAKIFTILGETPITAIGFNVRADRETACDSASEFLADKVTQMGLGFARPANASASAQIAFGTSLPGRRFSISVSHSNRGQQFVRIATNAHYAMSALVGPGEYFDLAKIVRDRFGKDHAAAMEQIDKILNSIAQTKGG